MIIKQKIDYDILYGSGIHDDYIHNDYIISAIRFKNVADDCFLKFSFDFRKLDLMITKSFNDITRQLILVMKPIPKNHIIKLKMQGGKSLELIEVKIMEFYYNDKGNLTCKEYWRVLN